MKQQRNVYWLLELRYIRKAEDLSMKIGLENDNINGYPKTRNGRFLVKKKFRFLSSK